eukprot:TRINITY_DN31735_c0_g1_i2.p1 TRINITY_DN31735_c0_g1~~TRINITY_DN31735_c0_g1_i2.p1  ORF type:complete len:619 (-),score=38.80 TRINITY_DN31735_c0_g1_i2:97-1953(-)
MISAPCSDVSHSRSSQGRASQCRTFPFCAVCNEEVEDADVQTLTSYEDPRTKTYSDVGAEHAAMMSQNKEQSIRLVQVASKMTDYSTVDANASESRYYRFAAFQIKGYELWKDTVRKSCAPLLHCIVQQCRSSSLSPFEELLNGLLYVYSNFDHTVADDENIRNSMGSASGNACCIVYFTHLFPELFKDAGTVWYHARLMQRVRMPLDAELQKPALHEAMRSGDALQVKQILCKVGLFLLMYQNRCGQLATSACGGDSRLFSVMRYIAQLLPMLKARLPVRRRRRFLDQFISQDGYIQDSGTAHFSFVMEMRSFASCFDEKLCPDLAAARGSGKRVGPDDLSDDDNSNPSSDDDSMESGRLSPIRSNQGLRNEKHFPRFADLTSDNFQGGVCHEIFYSEETGRAKYPWALIGEITEEFRMGLLGRPVVRLQTHHGESVRVMYYLDTHRQGRLDFHAGLTPVELMTRTFRATDGREDWADPIVTFEPEDLVQGHTVVLLYAESHMFRDMQMGIREESWNNTLVFRCSRKCLFVLADKILDGENNVYHCYHCGEKNPRRLCGGCRVARYCSPECQRWHWHSSDPEEASHRKLCKQMHLLSLVAKLQLLEAKESAKRHARS